MERWWARLWCYWHFRLDNSLACVRGAVLCNEGCLAASLASTSHTPRAATHSWWWKMSPDVADVPWAGQGRGGAQNCPDWEPLGQSLQLLRLSVQNQCKKTLLIQTGESGRTPRDFPGRQAHHPLSPPHLMAPWGLHVSGGGCWLSLLHCLPLPRFMGHVALDQHSCGALLGLAGLAAFIRALCFSLETTGGRRKQFLQCFWPFVPPAPQILNHQTFLREWVFPVNSIPAETGPINTSALCRRVYLAGKWVLPCKQEAPWSYYLQMRLKSHMFIFMGFENSLERPGRR